MATLSEASQGGDPIARALTAEIERRIEAAIDQEANGIAERVVQRLREEVGQITGAVFSHYEMSSARQFITIRVQVGPDNTKEPG